VRDDERRPSLHEVGERVLDEPLGLGVEGRRGLVEDEDRRVLQDRAGDGDPLALASGQAAPALADDRVVAARQVEDEVVGEGGPGRGFHPRLVHVVEAVGDVGAHRVVEEHRLLRDESDLAAQAFERRVLHVDAVDQHGAFRHVVEPRQQVDERRLARPARAHDRDHLARPRLEADVAERRPVAVRVAEAHLAVLDARFHARQGLRVVGLLDLLVGVEDLEDPGPAGERRLERGVHAGQALHRRVHRKERGEEGHEGAGSEVPGANGVAAVEEGAHEREAAHHLHERGKDRARPRDAHVHVEEAGRGTTEAPDLEALHAEGFHHAEAGDRLLHDFGYVSPASQGRLVTCPETPAQPDEWNDR
jgi:hypothetical protein